MWNMNHKKNAAYCCSRDSGAFGVGYDSAACGKYRRILTKHIILLYSIVSVCEITRCNMNFVIEKGRVKKLRKRVIKKITLKIAGLMLLLAFAVLLSGAHSKTVRAAEAEERILDGVFMGEVDLSGMTADEARTSVAEYVEGLKQKM